jgi:ClpP class serine protease
LVIQLLYFFLIMSAFLPMIRQRQLAMARLRLIRKIEKRRKSRLITLIHRQECVSFLGVPFRQYIDIEDSELILRAIRRTPDDMPIDILLHTPGGLVLAAEQIAHAIRRHPAPVTVLVPHYAMSGGTLLALAADEIIMDENAVLGPVDPQLGSWPAASILKVVEQKDRNRIDDETLILADMASKAIAQVRELVYELLLDRMEEEKARAIAQALTEGRWTHDYPITCSKLARLGLKVKCGLPSEVYELMDLYPQPGRRRPSVQYIPQPGEGYGDDEAS